MLGRPVHAGPVEATALGNVLVAGARARALGSLAELRVVVVASVTPDVYVPAVDRGPFEELYARYLDLTGSVPAFAASSREDHADG